MYKMNVAKWIKDSKNNKEPWEAYGMTKATYYRKVKAGTLQLPPPEVIEDPVDPILTEPDKEPQCPMNTTDRVIMSVSSEREKVILNVLTRIARRINNTYSDVYGDDRETCMVMFLEVCEHEGIDTDFLEEFFSKVEIVRASALVDACGMKSLLRLVVRYITTINNSNTLINTDLDIMKQIFTVCKAVEFIEDLEKHDLTDIASVISCLTFGQFRIVDDTMFCFTEGLWSKAKASSQQNPLKRYMTLSFPNTLTLVAKQIRKRATGDEAQRESNQRKANNVDECRKIVASNLAGLYPLCRNIYGTSDTFERDLDTNDHLIAAANCVYDHNTGRARKSAPTDMVSLSTRHTIPFDAEGNLIFSQDAKKRIARTRDILLGNHSSVEEGEHMLDVLAYATHGDRTKDTMGSLMFIYGKGGNGKSILTKFIEKTFGDYATSCSKDVWTSTKNTSNAPETELITFKGKRVIITQEIKGGVELQTELLKKITGGDKITPREMYMSSVDSKQKLSYKGTQVILLFADQMPNIDTTGDGLSRRFLCHDFPYRYVGPQLYNPDNKLHKLANNDDVNFLLKEPETAAAFFMYLLKRYQDRLKPLFDNEEKMYVPKSLIERTEKFIKTSNDINNFVSTHLEDCPGAAEKVSDLFVLYQNECGGKMKPLKFQRDLSTVLDVKKDEKHVVKRNNGKSIDKNIPYVMGYKIRPSDEPECQLNNILY